MTALLDHLWQSTLFALLPAVLALALRGREAGARFFLWFAASVKFLIPFSALMALGAALAPALPSLPDSPTLTVLQQAAAPFAASAPVAATANSSWDVTAWLLVVWAAGVVVLLLAWGARWLRLRGLVKKARPLSLPAPLPVLASAAPIEPGLVGIWRPVLILPENIAATLSAAEMNAILAHELCHYRRRDNLTAAIHMLVESLFWFHPLVWWLGRRMMAERERACDEAVLAAGNDPRIFAEGILHVCRFYVPAAGAALLTGADLRHRIETILANRAVRRLGRGQRLALAALALASVTAPVLIGMADSAAAMSDLPDAARIARAYQEQARPRRAIPYNAADFDKFAGAYQGDTIISLSRAGGHLYARRDLGVASAHMNPRFEIFAESAGSFFAAGQPAQFSFTRDALGRVNGLVFHQSGLERWFKRIDAEAAANIAKAVTARARAGKASPGTFAALDRYIRAMQTGTQRQVGVSAGIRARMQGGGLAVRYIRGLGALQSLRFAGVASDGMDLYDASFAKGHVQWWIAPLDGQGRIIWAGFANPSRKS